MPDDTTSRSWLIFTGPDATESEIEEFVLNEGFKQTKRESLTRVTRGVVQTLSKCGTADGKSYYLWNIDLDLMNSSATKRILSEVEDAMRSTLEQRGAVLSTPMARVVSEE